MLSLIIFLPVLLGAILCASLPARQVKYGALGVVILDLVLILFLAARFDWSGSVSNIVSVPVGGGAMREVASTFQFREYLAWLPEFSIGYSVGVDNLSMVMLVLTGILGIFGVLCSWTAIQKRQKEFFFYLMLIQTAILGTFLATDLFLFYMFWELMLIPLYFMIGIWGSKNRYYATIKFVLYTLFGSVLMLIGMIWMYYNNGALNTATGEIEYVKTYSYEVLLATQTGAGALATFHTAMLPFLALFLAFAIKVPLFPLHTWLPDAHTEAPTAGSVILAGVLLKTGGYGILRFCLPLFPDASVAFAPAISWLAVIAIIYGAMTAIVQTDIKRLVAYSSVSHMGFVVLGIFSMNPQGVSGAVMQMINHGISTSGLFLAVGMIYERTHTRQMSDFGGLARNLPIFAVLTMIMVLSSVGLPGLNGFIGEFAIIIGSMNNLPILMEAQDPYSWAASMGMANYTWVVAAGAASGVIFGAVYLLIMYQKTFFGKLDEEKNGGLTDLVPREWGQLLVLGIFALIIGLYPKPLFDAIAPATRASLAPVALALEKRVAEVDAVALPAALQPFAKRQVAQTAP